MSIRDEPVVLDTNIWVFGLRRHPAVPACAALLERLGELSIAVPRQILQELQANLSEAELTALFRLLGEIPDCVRLSWRKVRPESIRKYLRLGCRLGDAAVASHLDEFKVRVLVTENRHFLRGIRGLPFRSLTAAQALAELDA
jgi:hypothetical protein